MRNILSVGCVWLLFALLQASCSKSASNKSSGAGAGSDSSKTGADTSKYMVDTYSGAVVTGSIDEPEELCVDSKGFLYVAETIHSVVLKIDPIAHLAGPFTGYFNQPGCLDDLQASGDPSLTFPSNLWIDPNDVIYIGDYGCGTAKQCTTTGISQKIEYNDPNLLSPDVNGGCIDDEQNIFLYDTYGGLYEIKPSDHVIFQVAPGTQFGIISSMTMDADQKNIFISAGHKIFEVSSDGAISTIAGSDTAGNKDGSGSSAQFGGAMIICTDPSNNIYVADINNNTIRRVSPNGLVTTIAGDGNFGYKDTTGIHAEFAAPSGIAFTTSGNNNILYVSDTHNNVIRRITFAKQK